MCAPVVSLVGSLTNSLLAFILPAMFYLRLCEPPFDEKHSKVCVSVSCMFVSLTHCAPAVVVSLLASDGDHHRFAGLRNGDLLLHCGHREGAVIV